MQEHLDEKQEANIKAAVAAVREVLVKSEMNQAKAIQLVQEKLKFPERFREAIRLRLYRSKIPPRRSNEQNS